MHPSPPGWPRIASSLYYRDAPRMLDWLCAAYGFTLRLKVVGEGGRIDHSELAFGNDGLVMVGSERSGSGSGGDAPRFDTAMLSPRTAGGNTQSLMLYVDDVLSHCETARAAGARIVAEPQVHDYGEAYWSDHSYGAIDPEGHLWWFSQRLRNPPAL